MKKKRNKRQWKCILGFHDWDKDLFHCQYMTLFTKECKRCGIVKSKKKKRKFVSKKTFERYTFGNEEASKILVDILNRHERNIQRQVAKRLATFGHKLSALSQIDDKPVRLYFAHMLYNEVKRMINEDYEWSDEVRSFTLNVLNIKFKKWMNK